MIDSVHPSLNTPSATPDDLDDVLAEALALAERINQRLGLRPAAMRDDVATQQDRIAAGRAEASPERS